MFWNNFFESTNWRREKWVLITLIIGLVLTSGIHFLSQKSIQESSMFEFQLERSIILENGLKNIEKHLISLDNRLQMLILTGGNNNIQDLDKFRKEIYAELGSIKSKVEESDSSYWELDNAVQQKIEFNSLILSNYKNGDASSLVSMFHQNNVISSNFRDAYDQFYRDHDLDFTNNFESMLRQRSKILYINNIAYFLGFSFLVFALITLLRSIKKRMILEENLILSKEQVVHNANIKEQFLANMSHEIRTPLQSIIGFTNRIGKEKLTEIQSDYVQSIELASESLLRIVNDILDASKIESGMMRIEEVPFSLPGLLHSVDSMFQPKVANKDIYLKLHPGNDLPEFLLGDPIRLTQVLINLIANAIKFTEHGGIDVYPVIKDRHDQNFTLQITIKDSGVGIPESKLPHIFDRFEQADPKVTRIYGGSGLGLYIVKELVNLQDGRIKVKSTAGQGSQFVIEIPYKITTDIQGMPKPSRELVLMKYNFEDIKVLVAEDNLMNQRIVGMLLSDEGIEFDMAENGKVAIQLLENNSYDIILMDIQMPEMDGYSTTEYIRDNMHITTPIVAMTAHAFAGEREKALNAGMNDYISKPIKEDNLLNLIAELAPSNKKIVQSSQDPAPIFRRTKASSKSPDELFIDYNYLFSSSHGKRKYLDKMLNLFIDQAPKEVFAMGNCLKQGDNKKIAEIAHSLKSTVGYVGLQSNFQPILEAIEEQAKENADTEVLVRLHEQLNNLVNLAIDKFKSEILPIVGKP